MKLNQWMMMLVMGGLSGSQLLGQQCAYTDDYPNELMSAQAITTNQALFGDVEVAADRDVFSFLAHPYITYRVEMETVSSAELSDVEVRVFDPVTNLVMRVTSTGPGDVAASDIPPGGLLRRVYVDARAFAEYDTGSYTLSVTTDAGSLIDADSDDLPDTFENHYGLSTSSSGPNDVHGALGDFDGDGMTNIDEMNAGTDPTQAGSVVRITNLERSVVGASALEWPVIPSAKYLLQSSLLIYPPNWQDVTTILYAGEEPDVVRFETSPDPGGLIKVYRVLYVPE